MWGFRQSTKVQGPRSNLCHPKGFSWILPSLLPKSFLLPLLWLFVALPIQLKPHLLWKNFHDSDLHSHWLHYFENLPWRLYATVYFFIEYNPTFTRDTTSAPFCLHWGSTTSPYFISRSNWRRFIGQHHAFGRFVPLSREGFFGAHIL